MDKPTVALILGGGKCVYDDIKFALSVGEYDRVVAVNDIGAEWDGHLDCWISLHLDKFIQWREKRLARGFSDAGQYVTHDEKNNVQFFGIRRQYRFKGQTKSGSSGLFAVKNELIDQGTDKVVLAGLPMTEAEAHFFNPQPWRAASSHKRGWMEVEGRLQDRVKSCSGWTREKFGPPTPEWFQMPCRNPEALR